MPENDRVLPVLVCVIVQVPVLPLLVVRSVCEMVYSVASIGCTITATMSSQ